MKKYLIQTAEGPAIVESETPPTFEVDYQLAELILRVGKEAVFRAKIVSGFYPIDSTKSFP